ncbi:hypothetical protein EDD22DRAFT_884333 [Suillus occidentalis]|nr:hypothetical protein EDD22DRAFT_884333 [Suillus occidentalis]
MYIAALLAESHILVDPMPSSSSGSSDSSSDDSSGESDSDLPTTSEVLLGVVGTLYSQRYLVDREPIVKSGENLRLLLTEWKFSRPEIFRAYVRVTPDCFDVPGADSAGMAFFLRAFGAIVFAGVSDVGRLCFVMA